jgi:hypothetical protein
VPQIERKAPARAKKAPRDIAEVLKARQRFLALRDAASIGE